MIVTCEMPKHLLPTNQYLPNIWMSLNGWMSALCYFHTTVTPMHALESQFARQTKQILFIPMTVTMYMYEKQIIFCMNDASDAYFVHKWALA